MAFSFESQGAARFLTYRLEANEVLDQDAYGMLKNNTVPYVLSPTYSQFDDARVLRYDVSGLRAARNCFAQRVFTRQQVIAILLGVTDGFAALGEYMLEERMMACSLDCLYIDDRLGVSMVCVPVAGFAGGAGAGAFLGEVFASLRHDGTGDTGFVAQIRTALADTSRFSVGAFQKLLGSLTLKPSSANAIVGSSLSGSASLGSGRLGTGASGGLSSPSAPPSLSPSSGSASSPSSGPSGASGSSWSGSSSFSGGSAPATYGGIAIPPPAVHDGSDGTGDPGRLWPSVTGSLKDEKKPKKEKKGGLFRHKGKGKTEEEPGKQKEQKHGKLKFKFKKGRAAGENLPYAFSEHGAPANGMPYAVPDGFPAAIEPTVSAPPLASVQEPVYQQQASVAPAFGGRGDYGITEVYGMPSVERHAEVEGKRSSVPVPAHLKRMATGEVKSIHVTPFRVGRRRSEVDFHIADKLRVSRVHAIISYEDGGFVISDNASVNHTAVNGVQVRPFEKTALVHGDRISLGDEELLFLLG